MATYKLQTSVGFQYMFDKNINVGKNKQVVFDDKKKTNLMSNKDVLTLTDKLYKREQQFGNYGNVMIYKIWREEL